MTPKSPRFWDKFYAREILAPEADILCKWRDCHGCPNGPVNQDKRIMRPEPDWQIILTDLRSRTKKGTKRQRDKALEDLLSVSNWMILYLNAYRGKENKL